MYDKVSEQVFPVDLFLWAGKPFNGFHNSAFVLIKTIPFDFHTQFFEMLNVDNGVIAFTIVIATEPNGDIVRIDLQQGQLLTSDLCNIDRHLRLAGGSQEYCE